MKPMIDHEEVERVKKLEDVEWMKSKNVTYYATEISPFNNIHVFETWVQVKNQEINLFKSSITPIFHINLRLESSISSDGVSVRQ